MSSKVDSSDHSEEADDMDPDFDSKKWNELGR